MSLPEPAQRSVLFVCTANICRSPTAEAVFRHKATQAGISQHLIIDSAGTHEFKIGQAPAAQSQTAAAHRGYDIKDLRARLVTLEDIETFDFVVAMDRNNITQLHQLAPGLWQKPKLLGSYSRVYKNQEIADPYGREETRYEMVLDMIESGTEGLLQAIMKEIAAR